jgi:predicted Zn-dependent protease
MRFFWKSAGGGPTRAPDQRARPFLEQLESRLVPYALTGGAWPDPQLITLSFMPDGTLITSGSNGNSYSNMYAAFGKTMSVATWENAIISAAQTWAQYANINFTVVSDDGAAQGTGNYQQGDPGMGDIRFGAYSYSAAYLGEGFMPPPLNNYSIAGDIDFNSAKTWNNGYTYDLQTVALHEIGHALGLGHSTDPQSVMWPAYRGVRQSPDADDIAGIQAIYGARAPDAYAPSVSFDTATSLTPLVNLTQNTAQLNNLDITSTSQSEYFSFTTPALGSGLLGDGTMSFTVQSSGLSLLRPQLNVYTQSLVGGLLGGGYTLVGTASGSGYNGSTITVNLTGVSPLQTYYIQVSGADTTAFSTGDYALSIAVGGALAVQAGGAVLPPVALPNTQLLDGTTVQSGGGLSERAGQLQIGDCMAANTSIPDADLIRMLPGITAAQAALPVEEQYLEIMQLLPFMRNHGNGCQCPMCRMAMANLHAMAAASVNLSMDLSGGLDTSAIGFKGAASAVSKNLLPTQQTEKWHGHKALNLADQTNGVGHDKPPHPVQSTSLYTFDLVTPEGGAQ